MSVIGLGGCSDEITLPSESELAEFYSAGPVEPVVDMDRLVKARISGGQYRVGPGEVLELTMPGILQVVTAQEPGNAPANTPYMCRISDEGTITLPVVGEFEVAGKTLAEIEAAIIEAYHPKYTVTRPSVFAKIAEYNEAKVTITGAVTSPGVYTLRRDQMSVVALIMEAGGVVEDGAAAIRIIKPEAGVEATGGPVEMQAEQELELEEVPIEPMPLPEPVAEEKPEFVEEVAEIDVELGFDQSAASATTGVLSIRYDGVQLELEGYDLQSAEQKQALRERLAQDDEALADQVIARLDELAAVLTGGPVGVEAGPVETAEAGSLQEALGDSGISLIEVTPGSQTSEEEIELIERQLSQLMETHEAEAEQKSNQIMLPVRGLNIPFADVEVEDGDTVIVERLQQPLFTVLGLVNKPGNFPYPSHARYNLMQALGFAQGLDPAAEPRYATVYRLKPDGDVASATFQIVKTKKGTMFTDSLSVPIKPGDIVAVEHTPRTRTNMFFDRVFRINVGAYVPLTNLNN